MIISRAFSVESIFKILYDVDLPRLFWVVGLSPPCNLVDSSVEDLGVFDIDLW